jgi:hypothetical protein
MNYALHKNNTWPFVSIRLDTTSERVNFRIDMFRYVIAQIVGWKTPDPIHKMVRTMRDSTHFHLR